MVRTVETQKRKRDLDKKTAKGSSKKLKRQKGMHTLFRIRLFFVYFTSDSFLNLWGGIS